MFKIRKKQRAQVSLLNELQVRGLKAEIDDPTGEVFASDQRGATTRFTLDDQGRIARETTPLGRQFAYGHDSNGRVARIDRPEGGHLLFAYNSEGRLTRLERDQRSWGLEWDDFGNLSRATFPDGTENKIVSSGPGGYDSFTTRDDRIIRIERDELSRLTSITDPRGLSTQYEYSHWDTADRIIYADGSSESLVRDDSGRLSEVHLNGKRWAGLEFGSGKNLTRLELDEDVTSYTYDAKGRVTSASNSSTTVKRKYDEAGRLLEENQDGAVVKFKYNENGLLCSIATDGDETLSFSYDDDGRLEQVEDWDGDQHTFSFNAIGTRVQHVQPNGAMTHSLLDSYCRPVEIHTSRSDTAQSPLSLRYEYNVNDQIALLKDSELGERRFSYGPNGDLRSVSHSAGSHEERYQYDQAENCVVLNGLRAEFGQMNELRRLGQEDFQYDERGNCLAVWKDGEPLRCKFNKQNQLIAVERPGAAPVEFTYDGFGRRISKTVGKSTTRYIWAGEVLLAEISEGEGGRERRDYLFLPYSYCPLSVRINGEKYQYHTDHQGTPRWVTDARGSIVWSADYTAFGAVTEKVWKIRQPIRFPGHYFDEETGLHYNRARYYSPSLGRYLSRDPLGFLSGINFYTYAGNDPINDCDPLGLLSFWRGVAAAAAVVAGAALVVVATPVIVAGAVAVATGAAIAAGTASAVGMAVAGAGLIGVGIGLAETNDEQSVGDQARHILTRGLQLAGGTAGAIMTLFGFAGMAGIMMTGGGSGIIACGAEGGAAAISGSTASSMAAGGLIVMAAANQMAMSQATTAGGSSGGGGDDGEGDDGDGGGAKDEEIAERIRKGDRPSEKELNEFTDRQLRREGHNVQPNPREGQPGAGRQGDRFVDGVKTEYKHPQPKLDGRPPDANTIKNQVSSSVKRGGQARDIVVDARGTGLTKSEAEHGIRRAMHPDVSRGKVDNLRVLGDGFNVAN